MSDKKGCRMNTGSSATARDVDWRPCSMKSRGKTSMMRRMVRAQLELLVHKVNGPCSHVVRRKEITCSAAKRNHMKCGEKRSHVVLRNEMLHGDTVPSREEGWGWTGGCKPESLLSAGQWPVQLDEVSLCST